MRVPDLFANMRIKHPETFLEYRKLKQEGEIQEHYVKFIEPVFEEQQQTIEKCWTFAVKMYEITEEKKAELKLHGI